MGIRLPIVSSPLSCLFNTALAVRSQKKDKKPQTQTNKQKNMKREMKTRCYQTDIK